MTGFMRGNAKQAWALGLILLFALALRLTAVSVLGASPEKDALEYHSIAVNLVSGHGYTLLRAGEPTSLRPPVYPLFLAAIYAVAGAHYQYALYVQALINALLVLPLFWLARRISGSDVVGILAAGLFAAHTSFEVVSRLYAENLLIPLGLGFVIAMHRAMQERGREWGWSLIGGFLAGLMGLTKPEMSLLGLGLFLLGLMWPGTRTHWRQMGVAALVSLLMVGAWQGRDLGIRDHGQRQIASTAMAFSYYPAVEGSWWWPVTDMRALERMRRQADAYLTAHTPAQVDQALKTAITAHPLGLVKLAVNRVLLLWASPPVGSSTLADISPMLKWLALLVQYAFSGLALGMLCYGAIVNRTKLLPMLALALYMTLVYGLMHAIRRYGYTFAPEQCLLASWVGWRLWRGGRTAPAEGE